MAGDMQLWVWTGRGTSDDDLMVGCAHYQMRWSTYGEDPVVPTNVVWLQFNRSRVSTNIHILQRLAFIVRSLGFVVQFVQCCQPPRSRSLWHKGINCWFVSAETRPHLPQPSLWKNSTKEPHKTTAASGCVFSAGLRELTWCGRVAPRGASSYVGKLKSVFIFVSTALKVAHIQLKLLLCTNTQKILNVVTCT